MSSAELTVVSISTACWGAEESLLLLAAHAPVAVRVVAPPGELLERAAQAGLRTQALSEPAVLRLSEIGRAVGARGLPAVTGAGARALVGLPLWSRGTVVSFSQWLHLPLALAGRRRRARVVLDVHDGPFTGPGALVQSAAAWTASGTVAVSRTALRHLRSWPRRRVSVVPRPVSLPPGVARPAPAPVRQDAPLRLAIVGRLDPEKRVDVALEAHERLLQGGHDVTLDVVGAPHRSSDGERLAEQWPRATYHGRVPHARALQVVAAADLLLSTAPDEAFGRTIAEAALLGVPSLVTGGGPAELVEDGRTGFVVAAEAGALAERIGRLADDRPTLRAAGAAAARHVAVVCSPDRVARGWTAAVQP